MLLRFCVLFLAASTSIFAANPLQTLNGRYTLDFILNRSTEPTFTLSLNHFRIFPDGRVSGREFYFHNAFRNRQSSPIRGEVTDFRKVGDIVHATVKGRGRHSRFEMRLRNFAGQPDLVRGTAVVRVKGRTARIRVDNQRRFSGVVKI